MKALENIKWLEDVFVTRKEENNFEVNILIKDAFREAIAELEALNNRSYNNCKIMFSDHTVDNDLYCTKICKWVEKDFCCNNWEPK